MSFDKFIHLYYSKSYQNIEYYYDSRKFCHIPFQFSSHVPTSDNHSSDFCPPLICLTNSRASYKRNHNLV